MLPNDAAADRADQIFRIGPETLVASSSTIIAGRVSHYHKDVLKVSQPGSDGFPLEWKITAELADPVTLKGSSVPQPIAFSKLEHSFMSPVPTQNPRWEQDYGELVPDGAVVLFFSGADSQTIRKVLPGGTGEQDLGAMVKDIVSIQRLTDPKERIRRWLAYLSSASMSEGYRVALRSLAHAGAPWQEIEPALRNILKQAGPSPDVRAFSFGFVAFNITQNTWKAHSSAALDLLCTSFSGQADPRLALRNLSSLSLVLHYTSEQPAQASRRALREQAVKCLRGWASLGFADKDLAEEYKRMRQQYAIQ
jgi:hypothetical protein